MSKLNFVLKHWFLSSLVLIALGIVVLIGIGMVLQPAKVPLFDMEVAVTHTEDNNGTVTVSISASREVDISAYALPYDLSHSYDPQSYRGTYARFDFTRMGVGAGDVTVEAEDQYGNRRSYTQDYPALQG